jgi:hypothetical protein
MYHIRSIELLVLVATMADNTIPSTRSVAAGTKQNDSRWAQFQCSMLDVSLVVRCVARETMCCIHENDTLFNIDHSNIIKLLLLQSYE